MHRTNASGSVGGPRTGPGRRSHFACRRRGRALALAAFGFTDRLHEATTTKQNKQFMARRLEQEEGPDMMTQQEEGGANAQADRGRARGQNEQKEESQLQRAVEIGAEADTQTSCEDQQALPEQDGKDASSGATATFLEKDGNWIPWVRSRLPPACGGGGENKEEPKVTLKQGAAGTDGETVSNARGRPPAPESAVDFALGSKVLELARAGGNRNSNMDKLYKILGAKFTEKGKTAAAQLVNFDSGKDELGQLTTRKRALWQAYFWGDATAIVGLKKYGAELAAGEGNGALDAVAEGIHEGKLPIDKFGVPDLENNPQAAQIVLAALNSRTVDFALGKKVLDLAKEGNWGELYKELDEVARTKGETAAAHLVNFNFREQSDMNLDTPIGDRSGRRKRVLWQAYYLGNSEAISRLKKQYGAKLVDKADGLSWQTEDSAKQDAVGEGMTDGQEAWSELKKRMNLQEPQAALRALENEVFIIEKGSDMLDLAKHAMWDSVYKILDVAKQKQQEDGNLLHRLVNFDSGKDQDGKFVAGLRKSALWQAEFFFGDSAAAKRLAGYGAKHVDVATTSSMPTTYDEEATTSGDLESPPFVQPGGSVPHEFAVRGERTSAMSELAKSLTAVSKLGRAEARQRASGLARSAKPKPTGTITQAPTNYGEKKNGPEEADFQFESNVLNLAYRGEWGNLYATLDAVEEKYGREAMVRLVNFDSGRKNRDDLSDPIIPGLRQRVLWQAYWHLDADAIRTLVNEYGAELPSPTDHYQQSAHHALKAVADQKNYKIETTEGILAAQKEVDRLNTGAELDKPTQPSNWNDIVTKTTQELPAGAASASTSGRSGSRSASADVDDPVADFDDPKLGAQALLAAQKGNWSEVVQIIGQDRKAAKGNVKSRRGQPLFDIEAQKYKDKDAALAIRFHGVLGPFVGVGLLLSASRRDHYVAAFLPRLRGKVRVVPVHLA
eukprot:g11398.t1